ncbi:MAG: hypothetical protein PHY59_00750 [Methanobacterium sp.]|nr:hypothetical protein [Methanobacterium sp.]
MKQNKSANNELIATTVYIPKEYFLKLDKIKSLIFEKYSLRLSNTDFVRCAITDFFRFQFQSKRRLRKIL